LSRPIDRLGAEADVLALDRLYLASYTHTPNELTPFPYPTAAAKSPTKRVAKSQAGPTPVAAQKNQPPLYFTVDNTLLYNRFHADFGPLHIGHLYRFAVQLHEILGDSANAQRSVVFWSSADPRSRANAACLLACYMILIQSWTPHLALAPIAQADPPLMPFRDAGYSQADYGLSVQDVVYGVWRAKEEGLCRLKEFSLDEYVSAKSIVEPKADVKPDMSSSKEWTWATSIGSHPASLRLRLHSMARLRR
jgi:cell division cycle 14